MFDLCDAKRMKKSVEFAMRTRKSTAVSDMDIVVRELLMLAMAPSSMTSMISRPVRMVWNLTSSRIPLSMAWWAVNGGSPLARMVSTGDEEPCTVFCGIRRCADGGPIMFGEPGPKASSAPNPPVGDEAGD